MRKNKIGMMFIASAIALAFVGSSYAMWTTSINANETVNTATFGIGWSTEPITVTGDTQGIIYGTESIDGYGNLVVTIYNAYPCCDININYDIQLTGQVWAKLYPLQFTYTNFDPAWIQPSTTNPDGYTVTASAPYIGTIVVHLGENAVPGSTYTFTVTASAHQYNEP